MTSLQTDTEWPGREVKDSRIRFLCQRLVRAGYRYRKFKNHGMLYSPDGETKHAVHWTVPVGNDLTLWLADLRRLGWDLDPAKTVRPAFSHTHVETYADVEIPWTDSEWRELQREAGGWRAQLVGAQPEPEVEPEAQVEPAPVLSDYVQGVMQRVTQGRVIRDDARSETWSLADARQMIRDGYSVDHVVQRTGWGRMWLADLADRLAAR